MVLQHVEQDLPPLVPPRQPSVKNRIAAAIRRARKSKDGLSTASPRKPVSPVRDVEYGRDAKLSNVAAIAQALGLKLELVETSS